MAWKMTERDREDHCWRLPPRIPSPLTPAPHLVHDVFWQAGPQMITHTHTSTILNAMRHSDSILETESSSSAPSCFASGNFFCFRLAASSFFMRFSRVLSGLAPQTEVNSLAEKVVIDLTV